jgi:hypothetical protein
MEEVTGQLQYAGRATAWARTFSAPLHEALAAAEASSARAGRGRRRTLHASLSREAVAVLTEFWWYGSQHRKRPGAWARCSQRRESGERRLASCSDARRAARRALRESARRAARHGLVRGQGRERQRDV